MVDMPKNKLEEKELNTNEIENYIEQSVAFSEIDNSIEKFNSIESTSENNENSDISNQEQISLESEENTEPINCLALTVKKDYNLSVVKNIVIKTLKNTWRVTVSIITLNFLKFLF